ncbi:SRPBCC family protein [Granulosicoccus sp. 3-233]|uniref:SRPBCC family protein n=1 Tax=Granulosicoccus sp. 3-233 TaxID=3417969 RepID=UPI003D33E807
MQNSIQREITINASQERVYKAISDPEQVVKWFPETIEGNYSVGQQPIFGFGEHGKNQVCIVDAVPHEYFAFRWVPGGNHFLGDVLSVDTTLVEFRISKLDDDSCKVSLSETGFANLPAEIAESSHQQNSGGWNFMLGRLETLFAGD